MSHCMLMSKLCEHGMCNWDYRIAPNFRIIIFSWISWLTPRSRIFYSRKFNFWGRGLFTSRACDAFALNIKPGFDKDTLPAYFKKSNPSKAVLLVLLGLSRCECHPSVSGSRGGQQMRGRRAGENKRLNVRVGHKINQTRNVWEVHTQGKGKD